MSARRIKVNCREASSTVHLVSKSHNSVWCFEGKAKRKLMDLVRRATVFCGLEVFTHALMSNHPHLLSHIPRWKADPDDEELLRRYRVLNPSGKYRGTDLEVIAAHLKANTPAGVEWRRKQLAQMGDFSQLMKIVKERFTRWYNRVHKHTGTMWNGRFKSMLVEENSHALLTMAAYIDLNPVRAGIVRDPKNYADSGYGAAVAGDPVARRGIMKLTETMEWNQAQAEYRKLLYAVGTKPKANGAAISIEEFERVKGEDGKLSVVEALHLRIRRLTDGLVFGGAEFVAGHMDALVQSGQRKCRRRPKPLPSITDWGGLGTLRESRKPMV